MDNLGVAGHPGSPAVPETFEVPSATVPAFTRVSPQKSNRAQLWTNTWYVSPGAGQGGAITSPRSNQLYGPATATAVASEHGYHWRTLSTNNANNVTTYQSSCLLYTSPSPRDQA